MTPQNTIERTVGALRHRLLRGMLACGLFALLGACAGPGQQFAASGQQKIQDGRVKDGLAELEKAMAAEPNNREYRMQWFRQREIALGDLLAQADALLAQGRSADAQDLYQQAASVAPGNSRATTGLETSKAAVRLDKRVDEAQALLAKGQKDEAARRIRAVLAESPLHTRARALNQQFDAVAAGQAVPDRAGTALKTALRKLVSLEFRDAGVRSVFDALSRSTGINFVFDRDVRPDLKITISIANTSIEDVIGTICATQQLERKVMNENTVLIYPNTPAKQKEHLELSVKTFYLSNTEAKTMFALLKTVLKTRDLYADEKLNTLTMRDTADAIRLAERLVRAQDQPEPEVVLDVEVLEVKRSRLMELGVDVPTKFSVLNLVPNPETVVSTATGNTVIKNSTLTTTQLTVAQLRNTTSASVGIDNPSLNLKAENADTIILANPRIRAKNREKAKILIGDRVPVITSTSTPNVGVSESVSYLDVGLKLDVEPNVFMDNEVGMKVTLEVSNIVREVRSRTGTLTYQIGTRMASTALRLKDGETQALAGLIGDEDRKNTAGWPGAVDLPLFGRLFSSERTERNKTEIVLLITPRVVRNIDAAAAARFEYASGTESAVGSAPLRLQGSGRIALPPSGPRASAPAEGQPQPEPELEPEPASVEPAPGVLPPMPVTPNPPATRR